MALKKDLVTLRISKLERGKDNLVFSFQDTTPVSPEKILLYLSRGSGKTARLTPEGRLIIQARLDSLAAVFAAVRTTLTDLISLTNE